MKFKNKIAILLAGVMLFTTCTVSAEEINTDWKTAINTRHSTKWLFREKYEEPETLYASTYVNMREYPNVETGKVNKVLKTNTEVKAVADYNGWTQIVANNKNGEEQYFYILSQHLSEEKVKVTPTRKPVTSSNTANNNSSTSTNDNTNTSSSDTSADTSTNDANGEYLGKFKLTAYCGGACCNGQWAGQTASGAAASAGRTVAMAGVPFGTKLLINGHVYVVEDRGTPYGHVDIYFNSHSETSAFGVRYADVYRVY